MQIRLSKNDVHKLTHCPKCDTELEDYALVMFVPHSYCPKCDILKMELMSLPWLCSECDSKLYIHSSNYLKKGDGTECFLCRAQMRGIKSSTFRRYLREGRLRRGYFVSNKPLPRKYLRTHAHEMEKRYYRNSRDVFKIGCSECDYKMFVSIPEWKQKEMGILKKKVFVR